MGFVDVSEIYSKLPGRKCVPAVNECLDNEHNDCSINAICTDEKEGLVVKLNKKITYIILFLDILANVIQATLMFQLTIKSTLVVFVTNLISNNYYQVLQNH